MKMVRTNSRKKQAAFGTKKDPESIKKIDIFHVCIYCVLFD